MTVIAAIQGAAVGLGDLAVVVFAFLFVLTAIVFVHELGHFLVARWCGVSVSVFSIGFGKEIFGFNDRHGTRWRVAWIPLGGYVKFLDDDDPTSSKTTTDAAELTPEQRAGAFHLKPVWKRAAVVAAGPIANFIFAIVLFALMFWLMGVRTTAPRVDQVQPGTPAAAAGIQAGDVIREINGAPVRSFNAVQRAIGTSSGDEVSLVIKRGDELIPLKMTPVMRKMSDGLGGEMTRPIIGIVRASRPESFVTKWPGPVEAVGLGVSETGFIITSTLGFIRDIFRGRQDATQIGGLPHVAEATRRIVDIGIDRLPYLIAALSVSIGLINLFPIPLLDGGHLMFYAIEAVRRRPLAEQTQEFAFKVGLAVVLALMIYANLWNGRHIISGWLGLS
ncbi:MAG: M50 family metallopeptidase [Pseudomonadota bacterium]